MERAELEGPEIGVKIEEAKLDGSMINRRRIIRRRRTDEEK